MNFKEYSHIKDMPLLNDKTILKPGVLAETYIKKLHAAEEENKRLREVAASFISDVAEYGESFCNAAGHNPETCNECRLKELIK